jgi:hypothetical protein
MPEFEQHGWQGFWMPGRRVDGQHGVMVVIKRRFEVDMMTATCRPAVTSPITLMQEPFDDGEPPMVSYRHPSEIALEKPKVDIIIRATAYAPGGKPVPQFEVEFKIPRLMTRKLRIYGNRHLIWYPPVKWLTAEDLAKGEMWIWPDPDFSEPEPIDKLPLRYEHSYGGWAKIILTPDAQGMAAEAQVIGAVVEERREKKKEILEDLKKEEEEKKKGDKKEKPKPKGVTDEKAAKAAEKAFGGGGDDQKLDEETLKKLAEEEAKDDGMKIVSALRLGQHTAETAEEADAQKAAEEAEAKAKKKKGKDEPEEEEAEEKPGDPNAAFFSSSDSTSMLDISKLNLEDEFKEELDVRAVKEARKLKDEEGTLRDRATEFGDIEVINDDSWAAKYIRARPEKKKRKLEESEIPMVPFPGNLCGKGFVVSHMEEGVDKVPLPNIEDPEDPISPEEFVVELAEFNLNKLRQTAGWATYPMGWYPRAKFFGVYPWDLEAAKAHKEKAKEEYDEEDPDDKVIIEQFDKSELPIMHPLAFQEAHPKMQVKELRGDEECYFTNLTPDGNLFFRMPGIHPTVTIDMSKGPEPLSMRLDTVLFDLDDPKQPAVEMSWRGWYNLKNYDELGVKPLRKVNIIETDQEGWLEMKRKEASKETKKEGLTSAMAAVSDEEFDSMGEDALEKYRASFKKERGGKGVRLDDVTDAVVFDQTEDRQVIHDEWDQGIRDEKEAFIAEQKRKADILQKLKDKELKGKARDLADEEFGIIRDPDTGEILAVEPPEKPAGKGGKKK